MEFVSTQTVPFKGDTLQGTNISRFQGTFEDDFPFPQVGYVNSLEGMLVLSGVSRG